MDLWAKLLALLGAACLIAADIDQTTQGTGTLDKECTSPAEMGMKCQAVVVHFFYNTATKECANFLYGGCGGNGNNYDTQEACEKKCKEGTSTPAPASDCVSAKSAGPCYALFHRFHYNATTNECSKFVYGGCLGNGNNYITKEKCEATCKKP